MHLNALPTPPRRRSVRIFLLVGLIFFGGVEIAQASDLSKTVRDLQTKYSKNLRELAAWCEEKGLKAESAKTIALLGIHDPTRFYVPVLPSEVGPAKLPPDASKELTEWDARFWKLRREFSKDAYDLAKRSIREHQAAVAFELALLSVQANPDYESARGFFGYVKHQNRWMTPFEKKMLVGGHVWNDKFGWISKEWVKRYEEGRRFYDGKWISAEEDAKLHKNITSGWLVETEHYRIRTNYSLEAGVNLGTRLETLYRLWNQLFLRYYATEDDVIGMFDGHARKLNGNKQRFAVMYFRNREEYKDALKAASLDRLEGTIGMYLERNREAYFFASEKPDYRTMYHEATHQLFQESHRVAPNPGQRGNFWILEGIAMYMETLREKNGYYVLGGFEDDRMVAARYRLLNDHFYIPFADFVGYSVDKFQKDPKIATLYSQAAGMTNFLVHFENGRYRDALVAYLSTVYDGNDALDTLSRLTGVSYADLDKQYRAFMENEGLDDKAKEP